VSDWHNVSKTLPAAGTVVNYAWSANDTYGFWTYSGNYTLTTTGEPPEPEDMYFLDVSYKDYLSSQVTHGLTYDIYNGSTLMSGYYFGDVIFPSGTYTVKTYYNGFLLNQTDLSTATYGNVTTSLSLNMYPLASFDGGYLVTNRTVTVITVWSDSATNVTTTLTGVADTLIVLRVNGNASYVLKDGTNISWTYDGLCISYSASSLSVFSYIFAESVPTDARIFFTSPIYLPTYNNIYIYFPANIIPKSFTNLYRDTQHRWYFNDTIWVTTTDELHSFISRNSTNL
jgi:hypothetical protein